MEGARVNEFTCGLRDSFIAGGTDLVEVVYMKFFSMSRQKLTVEQLFPSVRRPWRGCRRKKTTTSCIFSSRTPTRIFTEVLPMFDPLSMMQREITVENRASEQAARVMAMQSANGNALVKLLSEELQLEYKQTASAEHHH